MCSGVAEYISAAASMKASQLRKLIYCLRFLGSSSYDGDNLDCEPPMRIVDCETAISMVKYNKDTADNRYVSRRYQYVRQGTTLNERIFEWIGSKKTMG